MENNVKKSAVSICAWCQTQFPKVDAAVKVENKLGRVLFSHSICPRHFTEMYKSVPGMTAEKIKQSLDKSAREGKVVADLSQTPELLASYEQGNFLPQTTLKERLQKLANIKK
jgi:hypothetical protein